MNAVPALLASLLLAVAFAGCEEASELDNNMEPPRSSDETVAIGGSFTAERTQDDMVDFEITVGAHGADDLAIMESFPEQFRVTFSTEACEDAMSGDSGGECDAGPRCEALRAALLEKEYLASVGDCELVAY